MSKGFWKRLIWDIWISQRGDWRSPQTPGLGGLEELTTDEELVIQAITDGTYFHYNETPTGSIDGSNVTFTLSASPNPAGSLEVFLNGIKLTLTVNYSLFEATLTMVDSPLTGDELRVFFSKSPV